MKAKLIGASCVLAALVNCRCGGCDDGERDVTSLPETTREIFELLFAHRTKARVDTPLEAIPNDLDLIVVSPDPDAWRAWAVQQPYVRRLMETPLFQELRMTRGFLTIDGLQHQASQAASLTGDDRAALWAGPTAVGIQLSKEAPPSVLLVKRIDEASGAVIRFAAAFAMLSQKPLPEGTGKQISGVEVRTISVHDESIVFAVFENLLIAGDNAALIERAVALAMKDGSDAPAAADPLFPPPSTPGVHLRARASEGSVFPLFGLQEIGLSLVNDARAPAVVRRIHGTRSAGGAALLRYAPQASFVAFASDDAPSGSMFETLRGRLDRPELGDLELEKEIARQLSPGVAVILGATGSGEAPATPAGLIAFAHSSPPEALESNLRHLLGKATGKPPERTILESFDGAVLLDAGGPSAAITKDALLLALDPERLRSALAAGARRAPSVADRPGVDLSGNAGGFYVDLDRAAAFLNAFYAKALDDDPAAPWTEAQEVLGPTFAALGAGGALFAKMEAKDDASEGALHVLP